MALRAPIRMPVQLSGDGRWFRPSEDVGQDGLLLGAAAPDELSGSTPIGIFFHLPGDAVPITCRGRIHEVLLTRNDGDREFTVAERRELEFLDLDETGRARIEDYVTERLGIV